MSKLIIEAAHFAQWHHRKQVRKYSGDPYILHPMRVAGRATLLKFATPEMIAAAWLHDTVEDCSVTCDDIEEHFGLAVRNTVWELTNPSKGKHLPRAEKKELDRRHLRTVSVEAKCLKLIDRIDNLGEARQGPEDWQIMYLRESRLLLQVLEGSCNELEHELDYRINTDGRKFGLEI